MSSSTALDVAALRLANERLVGKRFATPAEVVRWLGAVQSQDYPGAKWALAQRTDASVDRDIDAAFDRGEILRTHVLRPTWHFVVPEDLRWMLELTGPHVQRRMLPYDKKLGLTRALYARCNDALAKALQGGHHLTRAELSAVLGRARIPAKGQRLGHIMLNAELDRVVVSGARRGLQQTYALFDERVPAAKPMAREEMIAALARRYFRSHGPATAHDFAWWSGLSVGEARAGVESVKGSLERTAIDGQDWLHSPAGATPAVMPRSPFVHLLPNYDEYFIAFKDRNAVFDAPAFRGLDIAQLLFAHVVALDGRIVGGWRAPAGKAAIHAQLAVRFSREQQAALEIAARDYAHFLGRPVTLHVSAAKPPDKKWKRGQLFRQPAKLRE